MSLYQYDKTQVLGTVGRNAEMRFMPNGDAVTKFSVAVDRSYKPKDGDVIKRTIWYSVQVFGKFAETCANAKGADGFVPKLRHFLGLFTAQNVHDVACTKVDAAHLLHAVNGAEQFARGIGTVPQHRLV